MIWTVFLSGCLSEYLPSYCIQGEIVIMLEWYIKHSSYLGQHFPCSSESCPFPLVRGCSWPSLRLPWLLQRRRDGPSLLSPHQRCASGYEWGWEKPSPLITFNVCKSKGQSIITMTRSEPRESKYIIRLGTELSTQEASVPLSLSITKILVESSGTIQTQSGTQVAAASLIMRTTLRHSDRLTQTEPGKGFLMWSSHLYVKYKYSVLSDDIQWLYNKCIFFLT